MISTIAAFPAGCLLLLTSLPIVHGQSFVTSHSPSHANYLDQTLVNIRHLQQTANSNNTYASSTGNLTLFPRHEKSFKPESMMALGNTCAEAFGSGYVTCREKSANSSRICYNPQLGDSCCSNTWACPGQSFCFSQDFCCPNGNDPATCAQAASKQSQSLSQVAATARQSAAASAPPGGVGSSASNPSPFSVAMNPESAPASQSLAQSLPLAHASPSNLINSALTYPTVTVTTTAYLNSQTGVPTFSVQSAALDVFPPVAAPPPPVPPMSSLEDFPSLASSALLPTSTQSASPSSTHRSVLQFTGSASSYYPSSSSFISVLPIFLYFLTFA